MIFKAIELCQEQSTIFFYTDAPAKDEAERDTVINAAEEKQIDLQLFVQNETCGSLRKRRATGKQTVYLILNKILHTLSRNY